MDFSVRSRTWEKMDDPNMEFDTLEAAYRDINRCNKWLGGESITINAVWDLISQHPKTSYTILDMGCGDGTMLKKLAYFLDGKNVSYNMIGVDLREDVLQIARENTNMISNISFHKQDILQADSSFSCDILINTLTMHHFEEERIDAFLKKFVDLSKIGVVINDLHRSKLAYVLFKVFSFFFIQTDVAKNDGLISISKGFRKNELMGLAKKIPNVIHTVKWKWAFRYVWVMELNRQSSQ